MDRCASSLVLSILMLAALTCCAPASAEEAKLTNYAKALAKAKKEGKAVLLDFTGSDWCHWCQTLNAEVFDTPEFKRWAANRAVLVEIDFPQTKKLPADLEKQNAGLSEKFAIEGYPTIIVLTPTGKMLGKMGYQIGGPLKWTKDCDAIIATAARK